MVASVQRISGLQVSEDLDFQYRNWTVQRFGWVLMALTLVAAVLGLLGPGPLSRATAGDTGSPLWLEYDRFARSNARTILRVHLKAGTGAERRVSIWLDRDYLEGVQIEQVTPEPLSVKIASDRVIYIFWVAEPARATVVTFSLKPQHIGPRPGRVGLLARPPIHFRQLIFP